MNGDNEKGVILIADDEKEVTMSLKGFFAGIGYNVLTASDKAEAVKVINAISLDLIILEINMLHGIEILKHIKVKKPKAKVTVTTKVVKVENAPKIEKSVKKENKGKKAVKAKKK